MTSSDTSLIEAVDQLHHVKTIDKQLGQIDCETLARLSGFQKLASRKISAKGFPTIRQENLILTYEAELPMLLLKKSIFLYASLILDHPVGLEVNLTRLCFFRK